ncbi:hypothetical protein AB0I77_45690 [Streptomyces sp. NPDC050619]|uniref:hypothetical protein n=1 Tax=Streptomyces sp. NPDC050619 TaxID=3157214 RepID=UPI003434591C
MTDPELAAQPFVEGPDRLEGQLTAVLEQAQREGALDRRRDAAAEAAHLLSLSHGLGTSVLVGRRGAEVAMGRPSRGRSAGPGLGHRRPGPCGAGRTRYAAGIFPPAEPVGLPQREGRTDRIDQRRHAALITCLERREHEARAVCCRSFGAAVDVVDRKVVGDVRGSTRWVDRIREVAHTADPATVDGDSCRPAPVVFIHREAPARYRREEGRGARYVAGFEVHPAEPA